MVIQINGKLRSQINVPIDISKDKILSQAKADEKTASYLDGMEIVKEIYVPNKLVNFVVRKK